MKCPFCDTKRKRNATHCPDCGASYATIDRYDPGRPPSALQYLIPWGIAITAACALLAYGVYLFLSFPFSPIGGADSPLKNPPVHAASAEHFAPLPAASEGCFAIEGGAVTFLPELWDGSSVLTVPDTVDGQAVTTLASGCFRNCRELTTVILPETLTVIGPEAFSGCSGLRGLYLPDGMRSIGENAFAGCIAMEAICIPATVTAIAEGTFNDCASLLYINYGGGFQSWNALYDDFITPFTAAICIDGSYFHGIPD